MGKEAGDTEDTEPAKKNCTAMPPSSTRAMVRWMLDMWLTTTERVGCCSRAVSKRRPERVCCAL